MTYAHISKPTGNIEPGLTDFLIGIASEMTTIAKPEAPFTTPGASQTIAGTHLFEPGKGFYRAYQIKKKHDGKGDTAGSFGSKTLANEYNVFVPGIDAIRLEWVKAIMNEDVITLHKDSDCDNEQWLQLGNGCGRAAEIDVNYTTGTFEPTGEKGFFLKVKWTGIPFVYGGTVTIFDAGS